MKISLSVELTLKTTSVNILFYFATFNFISSVILQIFFKMDFITTSVCSANDVEEIIDMQLSFENLDLLDKSAYQTEIIFNNFLPYSDKLDDESNALLAKIKTEFGRCVMLRDINPGCLYWSQMLTKYILLYGLRFTKDEHITFIKLVYELVTISNLQPPLLNAFGNMLFFLLKKKEIISPEELELEWEPLYKLSNKILSRASSEYKIFYMDSPSLTNILKSIVIASKNYFNPNATQEILNTLRPKLYPFDAKTMPITMKLFHWFLPVQLALEHHNIGHKLWFHEFMNIWETFHGNNKWENELMQLLAKLASNNIGYIDWNPYIPIMFTRFIRTLNLPVKYEKYRSNINEIDTSAMAEWIASVLGSNSNAQDYLEKFLKTIETYFHPVNSGSWFNNLEDLYVRINSFVILRLHRERYAKSTWELPIPECHKLTETNIDAFVNSMLPLAMIAVSNNRCSLGMQTTLKYLTSMRPNLIVPIILEKFYPCLGMDVEPHKLITTMNCMVSISQPLVQGLHYENKEYAYPDGPSYVLPFLFSTLPGIDPNDPMKSYATLSLIYNYVTLIPMVDCSDANVEKNEEKEIIYSSTLKFEDFVLQFMDRVFNLINSSALEFVRLENQFNNTAKSYQESMTEYILLIIFNSLLLQSSSSIFTSALNKLRSFILQTTLETKIAGELVGVLCEAFSQINGELTLRTLFPPLTDRILHAIKEDEDIMKEENLDNQFLYSLLLLNKMVQTEGSALLPYLETILEILDKVIKLKSREGNKFGCDILTNILNSLCTVQALRLDKNYDDINYPYWKDWGKSIDFKNTKIKWYVPEQREMAAAESVFIKYFIPAITSVQDYIKTKNSLTRDELQNSLKIINSILKGCDAVLPSWTEPPLVTRQFESCSSTFVPFIGNKYEIKMPNGDNVRQFLVQIMAALQELMLETIADDINSLLLLIRIWKKLSMNKSKLSQNVNMIRKFFRLSKKKAENKLTRDKGYLPQFLLERVIIQQALRNIHVTREFTQTNQNIVSNLFKLSTSRYSEIRKKAQNILWAILSDFPNGHHILIPEILEILKKDTEIHQHAFKGALYLIMQNEQRSILHRGDWLILSKILPALVLSQPTENLKTISHLQFIVSCMKKSFIKSNIILNVPESCVSAASKLWDSGVPTVMLCPTQNEIEKGVEALQNLGENNLKAYNDTIDNLIYAIEDKTLHWRHRNMAIRFILILMQHDRALPPRVVRYFLKALINDSLDERNLALIIIIHVLKQLKRKHAKILLEVLNYKEDPISPGPRTDNDWLQYKKEKWPITAEQWDEPLYVHQNYIGYYTWPKKLEVYASTSKQPTLDKNERVLNEQEKEVDAFFSVKENIDKLIRFFTFEECFTHEEEDKFNKHHHLLLKGLFRNHGDAHLANILPHLREMVQNKQKSVQRCAAEIISGIVRGTKHWPFHMMQNLQQSLLPILKVALANITEETIEDWKTCFSTIHENRDPNKLYWLIEFLAEDFRSETSFLECARLAMLDRALVHQRWRMGEMFYRLLPRFEKRLLENPFDNLRHHLALILVTIFNTNLKFASNERNKVNVHPDAQNFVDNIYSHLKRMLVKDKITGSLASTESLRLINAICTWIMKSVKAANYRATLINCKFYPIINQLENNEADKELSNVCTPTMAVLAQAMYYPKDVPTILQMIENASKTSFWTSRVGTLKFLQVFLFYNMSTLLSEERWISAIRTIVLQLLEDESVEVREKAAKVLNGIIHCALVNNRSALMDKFRQMIKSRDDIRLRHAGILGLCAFILAHPYDIPKDVPPIFEDLSSHISDSQLISKTIRETLNDFKRTHCDGWTGLQGLAQNLTEDQFTLLQDLTMPPSHYA